MEEKKLTDEEIVKALEHCSHNRSCEYCYHNNENGSGEIVCRSRLMLKTLDLIHRLQAENQKQYEDYCLLEVENLNIRQENENLRIDNDDLRERNEKFYEIGLNENTARFEDMKKIERLEDEVKRLAKVEMEFIGKIADQKAEIERLTEENGELFPKIYDFIEVRQKRMVEPYKDALTYILRELKLEFGGEDEAN